jgi:hypothetical protein
MIVDQRKTPVGVVLMLLFVAAASTGSCHYCVAFTPPLMMTREGRRVGAGATGGAAAAATTTAAATATATARLHAFPSESVDPMTAAAQVHLQNDHFASSQTTSSVSPDSSSATSIAPPIMARPATESKGNEHKLARVEQQQQQEEEQEEEQVPVWERLKPVDIQGGSQRTWSFAQASNMVEVHVRNPYGNVRERDRIQMFKSNRSPPVIINRTHRILFRPLSLSHPPHSLTHSPSTCPTYIPIGVPFFFLLFLMLILISPCMLKLIYGKDPAIHRKKSPCIVKKDGRVRSDVSFRPHPVAIRIRLIFGIRPRWNFRFKLSLMGVTVQAMEAWIVRRKQKCNGLLPPPPPRKEIIVMVGSSMKK